jgi:hypothetical protein
MIKTLKEKIERQVLVCEICGGEPTHKGEFLTNFPDSHYHVNCLLRFYKEHK